jgi:lysozyme family protein
MNPIAWLENEFIKLALSIATRVVTKDDMVHWATLAANQLTVKIKAETAAKAAARQASLEAAIKEAVKRATPVPPVLKPAVQTGPKPPEVGPLTKLFRKATVKDEARPSSTSVAERVLSFRNRYEQVAGQLPIRWWFIGILHYREASLDFTRYLGNGQRLDRITTMTPEGRGPFRTFEDGAIDALQIQGFLSFKNWDLEQCLDRWERFNGLGYRNRGRISPYVWAGSNLYDSGKYSSDGVYDPNLVDRQMGCAVVLKSLLSLLPTSEATAILPL